jgi:c-di-GMP-binding flagellar brake protein YcgR
MILLQAGGDILRATGGDPRLTLWFGLGIAGVVVLILLAVLINRRARPRSAEEVQQYSRAMFRRAGKAMGLSGPQIDMLENLVRVCKVRQPFLVFSSAGLLDDTLKKGLYSLDNARDLTPEEKENRKALIFQIKGIIEGGARKGADLRSTTFLRPGQQLSITPEGGTPFASRVISNMKDFLTVSTPALPAGADTRWMRGTKVSVYLWRENDAGYSFPSKVLGYDTVKGIASVLIQHSKTLRKEQRRRNRRRELLRPCFYYPIRIEESGQGRKAERKAVVEQNMRTLGTVVDLSAGGCAIQALSPFEKGKLVMIEFDIDKKAPIRAFGKVMHASRKKGRGGVMHVMFTRVTRQYLNRISEFVYDFSKPTTVGQARQQIDRPAPGGGTMRAPPR